MTQPPFLMSTAAERDVARNALVALCREKGWRLWAVHVRMNHVHAVASADRDPGRLMSDLKARAPRDLNAVGAVDFTRKRWTRHGSTLQLFDAATVEAKIEYTLNRQGAPMSWYDGRDGEREL